MWWPFKKKPPPEPEIHVWELPIMWAEAQRKARQRFEDFCKEQDEKRRQERMTIESKDEGCITAVPAELRGLGAAIGKVCTNEVPLPAPWGDVAMVPTDGRDPYWLSAANDNLPPIVAFTGQAGSGKSTATKYLVEQHGYTLVKFAGPLKDMMRAIGLSEEQIEGGLKETPTRLLQGKTPRHAMQTLGTEWGRDCLGKDFWISLWENRVMQIQDAGGRVVVDDCRFANEAQAIRRLGGDIYRLVGRGGIPGNHESERGCGDEDLVIANDNAPEALFGKVDEALRRYG